MALYWIATLEEKYQKMQTPESLPMALELLTALQLPRLQ
jgi:hypothetical protein